MTRERTVLVVSLVIFVLFILCLPLVVDPQRTARVAHAKGCMGLVQKGADAYATANHGRYAKFYRDLLPFFPGGSKRIGGPAGVLPQNYLREATDSNYVFDLPTTVVAELLAYKADSLAKLRQPCCIGYGVTPDGKSFAIVGFNSKDRDGMPLQGDCVLVLTNHGDYFWIDKRPGAKQPERLHVSD
jgi:hypothetical protein